MSIRIITDSASDFEQDEIIQRNIEVVPMSIDFGGNTYIDGQNLTKKDFYKQLSEGKFFPKTSQPSPTDFLNKFTAIKEKGDEAVVICLSGALSGTYQSAIIAKNMADYDNIYIVDSNSATAAMRIMVDEALRLANLDLSAKEIAHAIDSLKNRIKIIAALDTLEYLYKGGRLTKTQASLGAIANLKPIVTVNSEGKVAVVNKALGKKKAAIYLTNCMKKATIDGNYPVYPVFSYDEKNCTDLLEMITAQGSDLKFSDPVEIGPTIGTHIGTGAYGLVYVEKVHH